MKPAPAEPAFRAEPADLRAHRDERRRLDAPELAADRRLGVVATRARGRRPAARRGRGHPADRRRGDSADRDDRLAPPPRPSSRPSASGSRKSRHGAHLARDRPARRGAHRARPAREDRLSPDCATARRSGRRGPPDAAVYAAPDGAEVDTREPSAAIAPRRQRAILALVTYSCARDRARRIPYRHDAAALAAPDTLVLGHRGFSDGGAENTIAGLEAAAAAGADLVEIDVMQTADERFVVMHDASLSRLTGQDLKVMDLTLDELRRLTVRDQFGHEGRSPPSKSTSPGEQTRHAAAHRDQAERRAEAAPRRPAGRTNSTASTA